MPPLVEMSGVTRPVQAVVELNSAGAVPRPVCHDGLVSAFRQPPPDPLHPFSELQLPLPSSVRFVPPTATTYWLRAGYCGPALALPAAPLSPVATKKVLPVAAPCCSDVSSFASTPQPSQPQLFEKIEMLEFAA